jgi:biopolymer transport protein ExbD
MAMSVGGDSTESSISDINTTPLVDVMLVLLIIFLVTTTVAVQAVQLKLPEVRFDTSTELLDRAVVKLKAEIDRQGGANAAGLELPEAHIRGDVNAPYKCIGGTIYTMQRAGFARVGFISEPPPGGTTER